MPSGARAARKLHAIAAGQHYGHGAAAMRVRAALLLCAAACQGAFIRKGRWQKPISDPVDYDRASPYQAHRNETYDWDAAKQRVLDHAMRDVARYAVDESHKATKLALRSALLDKTHAIWILQGRLFVHKAYLGEMKPSSI